MINKLRDIISEYPDKNNYLRIIKSKHADLYQWLLLQMPEINDLNERIYNLINTAPACENGNIRKFLSYKKGYGYCGRAETCKCLQEKCGTTSVKITDPAVRAARTEKIKKTKLKLYGSETYTNRDKAKETLLKNYGVSNPMFSSTVKAKLSNTVLEKYGVSNVGSLSSSIEKAKSTSIERYGNWISKTDRYKELRKGSVIEKYPSRAILYDSSLLTEYATEYTPSQLADILGYSNSSNLVQTLKTNNIPYKKTDSISRWEYDIYGFIRGIYTGTISQGNRTVLSGKEIDIYLPEINVAFECNGSYWHTELHGKDSTYHLQKTTECAKMGIRLVHLWEHEYKSSPGIIRSMIQNILQVSERCYARKLKVVKVNTVDESAFLDNNHIQGYIPSKVCLGICNDTNELLSIMSFGNSRYSSRYQWELLRFCNKTGITVVGGAGKLFRYFLQTYTPASIVSYCHKDKFTGEIYNRLGFVYSHTSLPAYYYTKDYITFENRVKYQKHKLSSILPIFDPSLTEWENMKNNGYDRIWDCGNDVWVWNR